MEQTLANNAKATSIRNENKTELMNTQSQYVHQATANNTRRAYQASIKQFQIHGGKLPANEKIIADYLTHQAKRLNPRTLSIHLTAISHWHRYQELFDPTQTPYIRKLLKGIYRTHGKPKIQAKALHPEHIQQMADYCEEQNTLKGWRNNAMIQIAYFGAFRRSELSHIQYEHLQFEPRGLLIVIPRSKTDQTGEGKIKAIPYGDGRLCPIRALKKWLNEAAITSGYVFRSINRWDQLQESTIHPETFNVILKEIAKDCKLDFASQISSHSLRRGFATSAAYIGAEFEGIKKQGGWKNDSTVRTYIEEGQCFDRNAAEQLLKAYNQSKKGKPDDG